MPFQCTFCGFPAGVISKMLNAPVLPKKNTIGIHYVEGVIKEEHFGKIIVDILGVPMKEVCGIDERSEVSIRNRFIFKIKSQQRYESVCAKFSGRELNIERGYRIRVDDISSNNTRICLTRVPFEVTNEMLTESFSKFGEVIKCENHYTKYGIFDKLEYTGNRCIWMKLNQHIPQVIDINQIKNFIKVKYHGQETSCNKCGLTDHLIRTCKTPKECYVNCLDININAKSIGNSGAFTVPEIHEASSQDINKACHHCSFTSYYEDVLEAHMVMHTGEKPCKCNVCGANFSNKVSLAEHAGVHANKQKIKKFIHDYKKKSNHAKSDKTDTITNKPVSENKEKPFAKKINPKEKPIACSECSSNFSTSHELSIHKSCHKKSEKMLICTKCVFECKSEQSFIIHSRSHTSGKPYACTDCDFTCPSKNTLKNHIKNHFCKKIMCPDCGDKFTSQVLLKMHMASHSSEKLLDASFASIHNSSETVADNKIACTKRGMSHSPEGRPRKRHLAL